MSQATDGLWSAVSQGSDVSSGECSDLHVRTIDAGSSDKANWSWRCAIDEVEALDTACYLRIDQLRSSVLDLALPPALLSTAFCRTVLRAKAYDVTKARRLLCNFHEYRRREGWDCLRASAVERELRSGFNTILPACDAFGHVVVTQHMGKLETSGCTIASHQRAGYYLLHRCLQIEGAQTRGLAMLLDFSGFRFSLLRTVTYADLRRGVTMLQDCFPARLAVLYVLHPPASLLRLVALLRPLLKRDSLRQKIVLLEDVDALNAHIPGLAGTVEHAQRGGEGAWDETVDAWIAEEARVVDAFDPARLMSSSGA